MSNEYPVNGIGEQNKNRIVSVLRNYGPLSRAEISRRLGISKPAVSQNVKKLIDAGLLKETGFGDSASGRKGKLLVFNSNKAFLVGCVGQSIG